MSTQKLVVKNKEKSELELLEFSDLEIEVEDDCSLVLKLANFGNAENLKITANLGQNSSFDVVFADFADSNITVKSQVNLNKEGASCKWHLASLSGHDNRKKFDISFTHHVGHTFALMDNYGVSREKSEIIFTGVNHILEGAKGSETAQNAKIIVFDPEARGTASPVLRIDENDVKASHHKKIQIGNVEINMNEGIQGKDNPKDGDGGNPCNTLIAPVSGGCYQVNTKADGWVIVLHKATSNKQYFVFEEGTEIGYKFGMMTYAENPLGDNGLLQYELVGDEDNYLTAENIESLTGFAKIEFVENYINLDTVASGYGPGTYKQNGVSAIAFKAYEDLTYLVGAAGSKMTCAGIVFVKDLEEALSIVAKGETVEEEGKDPVTYADVELLQIEPEEDSRSSFNSFR